MKSSDPYRARVVAEINIHDAIAAVEHFAGLYPVDRLSVFMAQRLRRAANVITARVATREFNLLPDFYTSKTLREMPELQAVHDADAEPAGYGHGV